MKTTKTVTSHFFKKETFLKIESIRRINEECIKFIDSGFFVYDRLIEDYEITVLLKNKSNQIITININKNVLLVFKNNEIIKASTY